MWNSDSGIPQWGLLLSRYTLLVSRRFGEMVENWEKSLSNTEFRQWYTYKPVLGKDSKTYEFNVIDLATQPTNQLQLSGLSVNRFQCPNMAVIFWNPYLRTCIWLHSYPKLQDFFPKKCPKHHNWSFKVDCTTIILAVYLWNLLSEFQDGSMVVKRFVNFLLRSGI